MVLGFWDGTGGGTMVELGLGWDRFQTDRQEQVSLLFSAHL